MSQALKYKNIPIFSSNYVWAISHPFNNETYIVDPGQAKDVITYLDQTERKLAGILITHSHNDHIGGLDELLKYSPAPVIGPRCTAIRQVDHAKEDGDSFELWPGYNVTVMHVPGHLPEHIVYLITSNFETPALLSGDTIFSSGCGKMFSGPADLYLNSLTRIASLPSDTRLYCAHEYTLNNVKFALSIEPQNPDLLEKLDFAERAEKEGRCTLPSTIDNEIKTNPFLRCSHPPLIETLSALKGQRIGDSVEAFALLRQMKDDF